MAGCISSPSSDIFSHMHPDQVLRGLRRYPNYMVQLERQLQHGNRCLFACVMVCNKIAACESLLAQSILHYTRLIYLVEQEKPEALEEAKKVMELLKHSGQIWSKQIERSRMHLGWRWRCMRRVLGNVDGIRKAAMVWPKRNFAVPEMEPIVVRLMLKVKESGVQVWYLLWRQDSVLETNELLETWSSIFRDF